MKKLSDYKGTDALDLWADIIPDLSKIVSDKEIKALRENDNTTLFELAGKIFALHKAEVVSILTRIDETEITALNVLTRLVGVISEIMADEEMRVFFTLQGLKI